MNFQDSAIKVEEITNFCNSCFSQGRVLSTLSGSEDLFMFLLGELGGTVDLERIYVCWECVAILKKMRRFQVQVQQAQIMLQQVLSNQDFIPLPLSSLCQFKLENINISEEALNDYLEKNKQAESKKPLTDNKEKLKNILKEEEHSDYEQSSGDLNYVEMSEFDVPIEKFSPVNHDNVKKTKSKKFKVKSENNKEKQKRHHSKVTKPKSKRVKLKSESNTDTTVDVKKKRAPRGKLEVTFNNTAIKSNNPNVDLNKYELCYKKIRLTEAQIENLGTVLAEKRKRWKKPKYFCEPCGKDFQTSIDFHRHKTFCHILKEETPGRLSCLHCRKNCPNQEALRSHWSEHNTVMQCKLCGAAVLLWRNLMRDHARTHAHLWTCKLCPRFKASYVVFSQHYQTLHKQSICDYCGEKYSTKSKLLRHIKSLHMPLGRYCKVCEKEFKDDKRLKVHNRLFHPELVDRRENSECNYCVECDKQFPSAETYRKHIKWSVVHNPAVRLMKNTKIPCPECGKVFSRKLYMNNHYKLFHKKETKHYCELCDKYLVSAHAKKRHIQGVHQKIRDPKTKVCDICGTAFQTNAVLIKHIRTHTGERPYKCAHCPAAFAQSSALNSHTRTQHKMA